MLRCDKDNENGHRRAMCLQLLFKSLKKSLIDLMELYALLLILISLYFRFRDDGGPEIEVNERETERER